MKRDDAIERKLELIWEFLRGGLKENISIPERADCRIGKLRLILSWSRGDCRCEMLEMEAFQRFRHGWRRLANHSSQ